MQHEESRQRTVILGNAADQPVHAPDGAVARSERPSVELIDATRRFGRVTAVSDISFSVAPGTICGLLAPSGDGKTTVLRLIIGAYPPSAGTVRVLGAEPACFTSGERRRVGYMPQHFVLYPELTVRRNLQFVARLYGLGRRAGERIDQLLEVVELSDARDRPAGRLSGGMQRRLQLAAALLHEPELLVVDEPTAGIDPILRARFWDPSARCGTRAAH